MTEGCATIAMSTKLGTCWLNPAMLIPGSRAQGRGTATSTIDQSGGAPVDASGGASVDDTRPV
ncbi:hypothetical protein GCM10023257_72320 [Streptomyces hyderabadensis]|uniref:Uncharacterized protein n=1 Tax=Streptomyces hyderabadensis TaxID=598549 RepID=A0ABP9IZ91_9ACTN